MKLYVVVEARGDCSCGFVASGENVNLNFVCECEENDDDDDEVVMLDDVGVWILVCL